MAKKQAEKHAYRVYMSGLFGALVIEADRYELVADYQDNSYLEFFTADLLIATFPVSCVIGVVLASHEVPQQEAFNAFHA